MAGLIIAVAAIVAVLAAAGALLANRRWPTVQTVRAANRVVMSLTVITLALMVTGCALLMRGGCPPDDHVCDGPTMGAMGVTLVGAIVLAAILLIGAPVAYLTLRSLRCK